MTMAGDDISNLWRMDATRLATRMESGDVTPRAVAEHFLERSARLNPAVNAFVDLDSKTILGEADAATARQKSGQRRGKLDGVPIAIKDNIFVAGRPARWGSLLYEHHVPERDDICVERLRDAGLVIFGKTTSPEFAMSGRTQSRLSGVTKNPWDLTLTPGGSSGGAAAAVAAGLVPLAVGTDAGGSTRLPASYTGLLGLRPSNGQIPRRYGFPPLALDFQSIGLITRPTRDLQALFAIVSGPDARDPASLLATQAAHPDRPLRLGTFSRVEGRSADPDVIEAVALACRQFAAAGREVVACAPPYDFAEVASIWSSLIAVGARRVVNHHTETERHKLTEPMADLAARGGEILASDFIEVLDRLQAFRAETSAHWGDFDALIVPTSSAPAWPFDQESPASIGGDPGSPTLQGMFALWVNAMGYCGLGVPVGQSPDGRPIGIQIITRANQDRLAIALSAELERAGDWGGRWPALAG
jgi:aspartyl-tRNA(Asn)/glutamyl-tRNA(Gln) amidotransferase subunit A